MQFLGRIPVPLEQPQRLALVFMCQNDPGMCEEWDANSGGNAVVLTDIIALTPVESPEGVEVVLGGRIGATATLGESDNYYEATKVWAAKAQRPQSHVLGHAGDSPDWLQGDETPTCNCCGRPMRFIAQLGEPPYETGCSMNFGGGGSAYLFACPGGGPTAKFLWQC
jgi:hypothetical protein